MRLINRILDMTLGDILGVIMVALCCFGAVIVFLTALGII